jgi:hypothetical protein
MLVLELARTAAAGAQFALARIRKMRATQFEQTFPTLDVSRAGAMIACELVGTQEGITQAVVRWALPELRLHRYEGRITVRRCALD